VLLTRAEGMARDCAVNLDHVQGQDRAAHHDLDP